MTTLLAFDTATERMSIALAACGSAWVHDGPGGAQASASLIPEIMSLFDLAGLALRDVDAIAFGRGPGAFTGLRTACSVAQGLALGAGKRVLPVDTLLAVAEHAREGDAAQRIWVVNDARMAELYAALYAFDGTAWTTLVEPMLTTPDRLAERWHDAPPQCVAGSGLDAFVPSSMTGSARRVPGAHPSARAMLSVAQAMWERGEGVDPALALPLYVRDRVALTTAERDAARAAKEAVIASEAAR